MTLRDQIIEALNSCYIDPGDEYADLRETSRHDGHIFSGACYVCRGDVGRLADAVLEVVSGVGSVGEETP